MENTENPVPAAAPENKPKEEVVTTPAVPATPAEEKNEEPKTEPVATESPKKIVSGKRLSVDVDRRVALAVIIILALGYLAWQYKGILVAATVNGNPISRLSVIKELEKRSGQQVLNSLVTKRLIQDEAARLKVVIPATDVDTEIATITDQLKGQGTTLADALDQQGMTESELREQILIQKELEKILAGKVAVTDEEVTKYISDNKIPTPKGETVENLQSQIKDQLKSQKFSTEAAKWVSAAKAKAKINYYVDYGMPATPTPPSAGTDTGANQESVQAQ